MNTFSVTFPNANGGDLHSNTDDVNLERMQQFGRIQKLSRAVDALMARHYAATEKQKMLDELEAHLTELEQLMESVETSVAEARGRCALLYADGQGCGRGALAGENTDVRRLYNEYGDAMTAQLLRHWDRLMELQKVIDES